MTATPSTSTDDQDSGLAAFAAELVPALLAALPVGVVILALGLFAQPGVFSTALQEGNVTALFLTLVPLFLPTIAALGVYAVMHFSKTWRGDRYPQRLAVATFLLCQIFVPLPFISLQIALLLAGYALAAKGKTIKRITCGLLCIIFLGAGLAMGATRWGATGGSWADTVPRALVGRALNGLERVNLSSQKRSVLIVNRGVTYTTIISTGYPPRSSESNRASSTKVRRVS